MNDQQFNSQPYGPAAGERNYQLGANLMLVAAVILFVVAAVITVMAIWQPGKDNVASTSSAVADQAEQLDSFALASSETAKITVDGSGYTPDSLTVTPGTTVTWENKDTKTHTLSGGSIGDGNTLEPGGAFSFTYDQPGEYTFVDGGMTGTITVKE